MFHLHRTGVADSIHNLLSSHSRAPLAFDLLFPLLRGFENNIVLSFARFLPAMARAWKRDRYLTFSSATVRPVGPPRPLVGTHSKPFARSFAATLPVPF